MKHININLFNIFHTTYAPNIKISSIQMNTKIFMYKLASKINILFLK